MNVFEKVTESASRRRSDRREGREAGAEEREREGEAVEKKLAARERIEQTSKEIKTTRQQMQNIIANMQTVVAAVAAIRAQLQLAQNSSIPSVAQDERRLAGLKKKLAALQGEIQDLRSALAQEERRAVQEEYPDWSAPAVATEAEARAAVILERLEIAPGAAAGGQD